VEGKGTRHRSALNVRAMQLDGPGAPLRMVERLPPVAGPGQLQLTVEACGVCRTDLHIVDGELNQGKYPLVLGHEVVARISALGAGVSGFAVGDRVGVPWLARTCGACAFCVAGRENLCTQAEFTGYTRDGGYAEVMVAQAAYCLPLPEGSAAALAPLLCAGLIGYRALTLAGPAQRLGFYGFGAAAHLLLQVAAQQGQRIFAFTRPGDSAAQILARKLGAEWAGGSDEPSPCPLQAALLFAPVGALVPRALADVELGGVVVCAGIHMSDIPSFPYRLLWGERQVRSVANLTRQDGADFFARIRGLDVQAVVQTRPLTEAPDALNALRAGAVTGAVVLVP